MQRPDRFLVLAGQRLDRAAVLADRGQRPVQMPVGAQDVRQDRGVAGIGLAAGLAVAFPVAGHRPRVDRIDGEPGLANATTSRFLSVSIAIGVSSPLPPCSAISASSALNPAVPVSIRVRATTAPSSSTSATS